MYQVLLETGISISHIMATIDYYECENINYNTFCRSRERKCPIAIHPVAYMLKGSAT